VRMIVVGLGIQGRKRIAVAGSDVVATVDPVVPDARYRRVEDVPIGDYDAAMVCTPESAKIPIVEYLLSSEKHVLVEKPLLPADASEISAVQSLARSRNVACYTAYNHRFEPNIARLKSLLDQRVIGSVYLAKLHYGNGTARDFRNSPWRDKGLGVVSDLGSHLLDLTDFLFGQKKRDYSVSCLNRFENNAYDHAILISRAGLPVIELEMSLVSWKNTFRIDVIGELGSLHVGGLCKWGPNTLRIRKRIFPSGRPEEEIERVDGPDPTWGMEYRHFQSLCAGAGSAPPAGTNLDNDVWIHSILNGIST